MAGRGSRSVDDVRVGYSRDVAALRRDLDALADQVAKLEPERPR